LRADQRVVDIAGHVKPALLDARIEAGQVDSLQQIQCTAARREIGAGGVEQAAAQRLQHARAAVVGGAAAMPSTKRRAPASSAWRISCPVPKLVVQQRIALRRRHQFQSAGSGHFNHRRLAVAHQAVERGHRLAQRTGNLERHQLAAAGVDHGLHRAFAAVAPGSLRYSASGKISRKPASISLATAIAVSSL
jgi:hypothetical protein